MLLALSDVSFVVLGPKKKFPLARLSGSALSLIPAAVPDTAAFGPGALVEGELVFSFQRHPVRCRVERAGTLEIECRLEGDASALSRSIERYFDSSDELMSVFEVNPEVLQKEAAGEPHLLNLGAGRELYLVLDPSSRRIRHFQLSWQERYLEGGADAPTRYGTVTEEEPSGKAKYKGSPLIRWEPGAPPEFVEGAARLLGGLRQLSVPQRSSLEAMVRAVALRRR